MAEIFQEDFDLFYIYSVLFCYVVDWNSEFFLVKCTSFVVVLCFSSIGFFYKYFAFL